MQMDLLAEVQRRAVVCDGGMGTQLMARGMRTGECSEQWNLARPAAVLAIHQAYRDAGCDLLTTNTFGASAPALQRHGHENDVLPLNQKGAQLAAQAADGRCLVLGDVGPFGGFLEPVGDMHPDTLLAVFADQARGLLAGGAGAFIIETMSDPAEMVVAVKAVRNVSTLPIIATYAFSHADGGFRTMMGSSIEDCMQAAIDAGADVVGANCGTSLSLPDYVRLGEALLQAAGRTPVIVQPNAGSPQMIDGKLTYLATPPQMAQLAKELVQVGVKVVGGCCGTTPEHLRAIAAAVK
jgi:methionine synthase I (cobalamin-dependent)